MIAHVTPDDSGRWLAVIWPAGALLVAHAEEHADALLAALSASDPVQPVLDVLAGSGVSVAPDFALVLVDETGRPRHAVVRGSVVVRTSGEMRISNFLLWQIAGATVYFTEKAWPEFDEHELDAALALLPASA